MILQTFWAEIDGTLLDPGYTTRAAAREHCEAYVRREMAYPERGPANWQLTWAPDEDDPESREELCISHGHGAAEATGYAVELRTVSDRYTPTTKRSAHEDRPGR